MDSDNLRFEAALSRLILLGDRMAKLLDALSQDEYVQEIYRRNARRDVVEWHTAMDQLHAEANDRAAVVPMEETA